MALIECPECGKQISNKAKSCPGCGFPIAAGEETSATVDAPAATASSVHYDNATEQFLGTMGSVVKLAMAVIQEFGWKIDQVNESLGFVTFQTGISMGSWSGISCSLDIQELAPGRLQVSGSGKQNLRGGQLIALNIGGEAQSTARNVIDQMKRVAIQGGQPAKKKLQGPKEICYNCQHYAPGRWDASAGKCGLHRKKVRATDTCADFSVRPALVQ